MDRQQIHNLLRASDPSPEMAKAIETGTFFVVATPLVTGYAIGSMEDDLPSVYPTYALANKDNNEMIEQYEDQFNSGERDENDEWEGMVLTCKWDGNQSMDLYKGESLIHSESWKTLAGF